MHKKTKPHQPETPQDYLDAAADALELAKALTGEGNISDRKAMEEKQVLPAMGQRAEGRTRSAQGFRGARLGTVRFGEFDARDAMDSGKIEMSKASPDYAGSGMSEPNLLHFAC